MAIKKPKIKIKDYRYFLNIMGYEYEVIYTDDANKLLINNNLCYGLVDYVSQLIYINKDQHPDMIQETLVHEILHAIDHLMNAGKDQLTEEQIDKMATGLAPIMDITLKLRKE